MNELKPGRDLDAEVGRKVFGYVLVKHSPFGRPDWHIKDEKGWLTMLPQYSTHIASAWMVVEKLSNIVLSTGGEYPWCACISQKTAWAHTAPHAICLAALEAVK